jgi:Zn-dependent M28 family amino/carboxypeptidase
MLKVTRQALPASAVLVFAAATTPTAHAAVPIDTTALEEAVVVEAVRLHQAELQAIADANGGTRASGTEGYDASVDYVFAQLQATGYFDVRVQPFEFLSAVVLGPSVLEQVAPGSVTYVEGIDFDLFTQTEPGDVTALVTAVDVDFGPLGDGFDNTSTSGCEAADFAGFPAGNIALLQRGTCTFQIKAENAAAAGAVGAIIFNQGNTIDRRGLIAGTLSAEYSADIPVFEATYDLGVTFANTPGLELHMFANVFRDIVTAENVIAETKTGRDDRVVLVGAHLDSVPEGPGIQDNGSGSAAILEIALQMAELGIQPRNQVRFAWWGAEESGLVGSQYYVDQLSKREIKDIALNLNFDMIGSPNFVRFVYDGDGSATPLAGPNGSKNIETVFLDWFASEGLPVEPTAFDGRSDYGPFIAAGIPAGGLFTGAEEIKTEEEVAIYGGIAGEQYDPCYHLACDTYSNVSEEVLAEMSDAAAHAMLTFAMATSSVNGTAKGSEKAMRAAEKMEFLGNHLRK